MPVTTDIAGRKDAHSVRLDREASDAIKNANLHRKVAAVVFFESNGGMSQTKAVATLPEIRAAVSSPDLDLVDIDNVLEGLVGTCYYLNWDRNRYRFGLTPNLNQILVTRRGAVQPKEITDRVKQETQDLCSKGTKVLDRRFFAERTGDVPNRPVLTLCVLGLDYPAGEKATDRLMNTIVQECGSSRRIAEIRVITPPDSVGGDGSDDGKTKPQKKAIRWAGEIPPQKWMNFYMKVVSRFASREGLKLRVTLEVPAESGQGQTDAEDVRSGLKELGLDDDVRLG